MSGLSPAQGHRLANAPDLGDDVILARAHQILARRVRHADEDARAERGRLLREYAAWLRPERHTLGKEKLTDHEALLLMALERSKYVVHADRGQTTWNGDATCKFGLRDTVIVMLAGSRAELLAALWSAVSGQGEGGALVTEDHLRGSVVAADLQTLRAELHVQEQQDRSGGKKLTRPTGRDGRPTSP